MEYIKDLWNKIKADFVKAHKSLTIWFNGIVGTLVLLLPVAQDQLPSLQEYVPQSVYHYAMGFVIFGNIILRFKTTTALANK